MFIDGWFEFFEYERKHAADHKLFELQPVVLQIIRQFANLSQAVWIVRMHPMEAHGTEALAPDRKNMLIGPDFY
ncbi:hypothetical protein D3877_28015 [Azospirillum cavernae]|uniref:Uncharacterized protein n=1 Tax=Azospirillum cavernae TaxID=2320860 RepID=A0A418VKS6_9PROT|nr:hypothetical protein D3877_28015 [Azospirillum cavernae]